MQHPFYLADQHLLDLQHSFILEWLLHSYWCGSDPNAPEWLWRTMYRAPMTISVQIAGDSSSIDQLRFSE